MRSFLAPILYLAALTSGDARASEQSPQTVLRGIVDSCAAPHGKGNVYAPHIVRHQGQLLMYYGGQGRDGHDRIHLAISKDGQGWKPQGIVLAPKDIHHVNDPSVVVVNGKFYMYHTRAKMGVTDTIGLAVSKDGRRWRDLGTVLRPRKRPAWDALLVGRPSVMHDGKVFRMWFDGRADLPIGAPDPNAPKSAKSQRYVGYASSRDGITWTRRDRHVLAHDAGAVHVSRIGARYVMLIESRKGTQWATSDDGLAWRHRGVLIERDVKTAPHGHVTPFLHQSARGRTVYFGAAASPHWNRNTIMRTAFPRVQGLQAD